MLKNQRFPMIRYRGRVDFICKLFMLRNVKVLKQRKQNKQAIWISVVIAFWLCLALFDTPTHASGSIAIERTGSEDEHNSATILPTSNGWQSIIKDSMSIITDNATGYRLYISMVEEDNALVSEHGKRINSTTATTESPAPLSATSWGFAVPSLNAFTTLGGFNSDYESFYQQNSGEAAGEWAAVPSKSDMVLVQETEAQGSYDFDIYYGIFVGKDTMAGTYSGTVLYTAIANPVVLSYHGFAVSPNSTDNLSGGHEVMITVQVSPAVDRDDIGDVSVRIGEGVCENASGTITDGVLVISCIAPALPPGTYDIVVSFGGLDGSTRTISEGYAVELQRVTDSLSVVPGNIKVDTVEELHISTGITTPNLTSEDINIMIGGYSCRIGSAVYNTGGTLDIVCVSPEIPGRGIIDLAMTVVKYGATFHANLVVGDLSLSQITYMQEMTSDICANTATPSTETKEDTLTVTLIDQRDDKEYTVSKLADGNCWMTQNLRLGGDEAITLTGDNSNVETDFVLPKVQTSGKEGWNNGLPHVYETGSDESGNLYNWIAATAGVGVDGSLSSDVTSSICPRGWILPSANGNPGYLPLLAAYGWGNGAQAVSVLTEAPFRFPFSGGYYYGYGGTKNGEFWTSSPVTDNTVNSYYFKTESLSKRAYTTTNKPRSGGTAVRCVAERSE